MYQARIKLCNNIFANLSGGIHMNGWIGQPGLPSAVWNGHFCLSEEEIGTHFSEEDIFLLKNFIWRKYIFLEMRWFG